MTIYISIWMFIIGTIFGSFYNVVGLRLPKGQSIVSPPSHCPNCNNRLTSLELIPIISYVIQKGKCKHCNKKISIVYPVFEIVCGLLFMISYLVFGFNKELIIALTFISMLIIIVVSDFNYFIIPDSILIIFGILLIIEIAVIKGNIINHLLNGLWAFIFMFLLKKFGDFLFKKESMGGGDIKLMFIIGLTLSFSKGILSIFFASFIGLPVSLIYLNKSKDHIIPFGPFLALGSIIILFTGIDLSTFLNLYN